MPAIEALHQKQRLFEDRGVMMIVADLRVMRAYEDGEPEALSHPGIDVSQRRNQVEADI